MAGVITVALSVTTAPGLAGTRVVPLGTGTVTKYDGCNMYYGNWRYQPSPPVVVRADLERLSERGTCGNNTRVTVYTELGHVGCYFRLYGGGTACAQFSNPYLQAVAVRAFGHPLVKSRVVICGRQNRSCSPVRTFVPG